MTKNQSEKKLKGTEMDLWKYLNNFWFFTIAINPLTEKYTGINIIFQWEVKSTGVI